MPRDYLLQRKNTMGLGLGEDIFIEIAHGPCLVDNNILLSERAIKLPTQGVAFVHNLIAGSVTAVGKGVKNGSQKYDSTRYTPIHLPHRTEITGFMSILHGDVRFYNNVFVQQPVREQLQEICKPQPGDPMEWDDNNLVCGTLTYSGYMTQEQWESCFEGYCGEGCGVNRDRYYMPLPVWMGGNVYFNGAQPADIDTDAVVDTQHHITLELKQEDGVYHLATNLADYLPTCQMIDSNTLGLAFEPEERFETPEGEDIVFDTDFYGNKRGVSPVPGPFAN